MPDVLGKFSEEIKGKKAMFLLVIATTDVSLIPGITIAGATEELTHFTPPADAEFLILGKCKVINAIPVTPSGLPTPAVISRASLSLLKINALVVDAGSKIKPKIPYVDLGGEPGRDIRKGSLKREVAERIIERGTILGEELSNDYEVLIIGESIPAGTTTAMATLVGLGYDAMDKVSSASPDNPKSLKRKIVEEALRDLPSDLMGRLSKLSDPMLLGVAGISLGFKGKVLLAGGTQMVAASAVIKELGREKIKDVGIGTTRWIVEDKSSDIIDLARQTGVKLSFVNLDFSKSRFDGLRAYERGFVKEGVGAGGLSLFATLQGISEERILSKVEEIYENLLKEAK